MQPLLLLLLPAYGSCLIAVYWWCCWCTRWCWCRWWWGWWYSSCGCRWSTGGGPSNNCCCCCWWSAAWRAIGDVDAVRMLLSLSLSGDLVSSDRSASSRVRSSVRDVSEPSLPKHRMSSSQKVWLKYVLAYDMELSKHLLDLRINIWRLQWVIRSW